MAQAYCSTGPFELELEVVLASETDTTATYTVTVTGATDGPGWVIIDGLAYEVDVKDGTGTTTVTLPKGDTEVTTTAKFRDFRWYESDPVEVVIPQQEDGPPTPTNLKVASTTDTTATLTWNEA